MASRLHESGAHGATRAADRVSRLTRQACWLRSGTPGRPPDLHPGKGSPIVPAFAIEGWLYPALVGNDIACDVAHWRTGLSAKVIKRDAWADRLRDLDGPWDGDAAAFVASREIETSGFEHSLGTIGSGNHFAEPQTIESLTASDTFGITDGRKTMFHCPIRGPRPVRFCFALSTWQSAG
ncbi:MAG TPA: RtcB family protein [Bryobacteraceae bacterium]|nr:RtcB family protein [Bryobacteraceae bacterium]